MIKLKAIKTRALNPKIKEKFNEKNNKNFILSVKCRRVLTASGTGIRNARVILTESNGTTRTVITGCFGHYRFADVPAGQTVVVGVFAKNFHFAEPTQIFSLSEEAENIDFIASDSTEKRRDSRGKIQE